MYIQAFRTFPGGSSIGLEGKIDNFCVYVKDKTGVRAPLDTEYFQFIHDLATEYGTLAVYNAFKRIYDVAHKELHPEAISVIDQASKRFSASKLKPELYFSILSLHGCRTELSQHKVGKKAQKIGHLPTFVRGNGCPRSSELGRGKPACYRR